jgi:large subunit ribosomal protein L17
VTHHRKAGRQLRRTSEQRLALLRNLAISLIERGSIETTEAKAKELRPFVEKLITKAKRGTLHSRRLAARDVHVRRAADTLFHEVAPAVATRPGGYTRILRTGHRKGDGADMARIELIDVVAKNGETSRAASAGAKAEGGKGTSAKAATKKESKAAKAGAKAAAKGAKS